MEENSYKRKVETRLQEKEGIIKRFSNGFLV